ncbi:type I-E CRISPR-associated endonuclease Cas1e [Nakamurella aerolata]|uniref:CRISPR-associated endonuclease Cas1 n=1 Tax=Nakamurella aerolata TaxID=1656892 RepID=A0A849A4A4_9ACTN|nr:type I-E CRISPR-associated endonuclease Cas1e [Nakamurella aerolata]NNG35429.1 type I-E CRISPR-associated endonuclease Cas1 [Nakamurella aerolata]
MKKIPGARPPTPTELVRASDRISFLYVERGIVHRADSAITVTDSRGTIHVPSAQLACILFGPGCRVTHHAMMLLGDSGTTAVWVGENGVRFYAGGRGLARSTRLLEAQAKLVTNERNRLGVARAMYEMRFPDEDVSSLTMQQLRGREGARVRAIYRAESERTGVAWHRRDYRPDDFDASDEVNKALSAANSALYGVVHSMVVAVGCSPGLGFVHTGGDRAFVHDVADLYKAEITIPAAFDAVAEGVEDVPAYTRRVMRDRVYEQRLLERCIRDIRRLLLGDAEFGDIDDEWRDVLMLWDGAARVVAGGVNYSGSEVDFDNLPDEDPF